MLICGVMVAISYSSAAARRLLFASLIYLPALLVMMAVDKIRL
jgi:heme O synthase-like polyprenyltransferase